MRALPIIAAALLAGCADNFVEADMLAKATEICAPNEGLQTVRVDFVFRGGVWVEGACKNAVQYRFALRRGR